jgi:hypothetical protein
MEKVSFRTVVVPVVLVKTRMDGEDVRKYGNIGGDL